jgi:predicted amidophosphoribosyltransferase
LRDLVHLFKYRRIRSLDKPLGRLLALALPRQEPLDLIIPVPMHWWRKWNRGFNQAELLGRVVSRRNGLPFRKD